MARAVTGPPWKACSRELHEAPACSAHRETLPSCAPLTRVVPSGDTDRQLTACCSVLMCRNSWGCVGGRGGSRGRRGCRSAIAGAVGGMGKVGSGVEGGVQGRSAR